MSRPPDYRGPALLPGGWSARCGAHSPAPGAGRARTGGYHRVTQRGSVRPATSRGPTVNMYLRLLLFMIRVRFASRLSIWDTSHTAFRVRSEEHTSELQSRGHLVCRLLLEKKKSKLTVLLLLFLTVFSLLV